MGRFIMILVAIGCGIAGTFMVLQVSQPSVSETKYVEVVVASKFFDAGTLIDETMVKKRRIPADYAGLGVVTWDRLGNEVLGQRLVASVREGGLITPTSLESTLQGEFEGLIPMGQRAMSISVSSSTGVSGLLRPGSHVDVIAMFSEAMGAGNITPTTKIRVLLQNVEVLAVGRQTSTLVDTPVASSFGGSGAYSTITVAVTLEEAEILIAAETRGKLYCVLRNPAESPVPVEIPEKPLNEALGTASLSRVNELRQGLDLIGRGSSASDTRSTADGN